MIDATSSDWSPADNPHAIAISEERNATTGTDSSRYLAAGAARSFWVRTRQGKLAEAMPRLFSLMDAADSVIIESNSVLGFLQPDLYATVLDPEIAGFKASALRYLDRAGAVLSPEGAVGPPAGSSVPRSQGPAAPPTCSRRCERAARCSRRTWPGSPGGCPPRSRRRSGTA